MRRFAALYERLDRSTGTGDKRAALVAYFRDAPPRDAAWALWLLAGGKVGGARAKIAATGELRSWIALESGNPDWLVEPPAATEVPESNRLTSVDGTDQSVLDPEVQAKEAEEAARRDEGK